MASRKPGRRKGTRKTGGRTLGTPNRVTVEVREAARRLVEDPVYRRGLARRMRSGKVAPGMELGLWYYAYGKPKDTVDLNTNIRQTLTQEQLDKMTTAEKQERLAKLAAELGDVQTRIAAAREKLARGSGQLIGSISPPA